MKRAQKIHAGLLTFLMYFALCAFVITCSFLLFFQWFEVSRTDVHAAALYTFLNVIFLALLLVGIDTLRRKNTVDRPVRQIKNALEKITNGDFSVRLSPEGNQGAFAEIMESINCMTAELAGLETLRTDFIADVSHEMKTPLTVLQNYATLLQIPDTPEETRVEYAAAISRTSSRLASLITNILNLNRLENQQIYPNAVEYDLGEQLCGCLLQFESTWEKARIEIETDITPDITIKADRTLLTSVWNNLLSNAFKFTDTGGMVSVSLSADEVYATVQVRDSGCGMTPEVGKHIFEKFYQGDTSRATEGNGLGLALVKRIIDITGGEISVQSTLGEGTRFIVRLRRYPDED